MTDLVAFLTARLDEDEAVAKAANPGPWMTGAIAEHLNDRVVYGEGIWPGHIQQVCNTDYADPKNGPCIARFADPARVLAEITAKRKLIEFAADYRSTIQDHYGTDTDPDPMPNAQNPVLLALAIPYAGHPDFDESWRT